MRGLDETADDVLLINKQMNTSVAGDGQVPGHVRSCRIVSTRGTCVVQVGAPIGFVQLTLPRDKAANR